MNTIESSIRDLFARQLMDVVDGLESIFLVDLDSAEIVVAYPEAESLGKAFLAEICGTTVSQIEQKARSVRSQLSIASMEIRTEANMLIVAYKIMPTWLICLLGKEENFRAGFVKRLCEGPIKDEIARLFSQHNINL
jgi:hypothetical protein